LMFPCAVVGARSARRILTRWKTEAIAVSTYPEKERGALPRPASPAGPAYLE
jgi:hypothetical protein